MSLENKNEIYAIGELVEVKRYNTGEFGEGKTPYVSAVIVVKSTIDGNDYLNEFETFTSAIKNDGTPNKNYKSILNIKEYLNKRVVISGASFAPSRFWNTKTNQLTPSTKLRFNIINLARENQSEDKVDFKFGGFVYRELAEKTNSDGDIEYYVITLAQANYKGTDMGEVQFVVEKDNLTVVKAINENYEQGATVVIGGQLKTIVTTEKKEEEVAFGEPQIRVFTKTDKKFVIYSGSSVITGEGEYTTDNIKALVEAYKASGEKIKMAALDTSKAEANPVADNKKVSSKKSALGGLI